MTIANKIKGFTLIEVVIALAITSLLLTLVISSYRVGHQTYLATDTKAEITQNGRVILDRMVREIRQTQDVVTEIPTTNNDPETLPEEIMFQDGHDMSEIKYIRYYLDNNEIRRQTVVYYFSEEPNVHTHWHATDEDSNPPEIDIIEDRVIGEYVYDIEFWGDKLININLYLANNNYYQTINTSIYGRNL